MGGITIGDVGKKIAVKDSASAVSFIKISSRLNAISPRFTLSAGLNR